MSQAGHDVDWTDAGQVMAWASAREAERLNAPSSEAREWFTSTELAGLALQGLPATRPGIERRAKAGGWTAPEGEGRFWRKRLGRGGGVEFHVSLLPIGARQQLRWRHRAGEPATSLTTLDVEERERDALWSWWEKQKNAAKAEGKRRLAIINEVIAEQEEGRNRMTVLALVLAQHGVSPSTFYEWEDRIKGRHKGVWLPLLTPRRRGGVVSADCSTEAWDYLSSAWLSPSRPSFEMCYRTMLAAAAEHGWTPIPSKKTLERRVKAMPRVVVTASRQGEEALKRLYPAHRRTREALHALAGVNADGHKFDVFVRWEDGTIGRPMMVAFQDLYSGKILSWRVDRSESKELIRLAFGDMVENWGIPDICTFDNGRGFNSKWLTGQMQFRHRFKVKEEEVTGILTQLGVEVRVTQPYAGQSKPIERAFRDLATDIAKHDAFIGAYTGNNPMAKPENYGSKAVPIAEFVRVLDAGIAEHNARSGRKSDVCRARKLSFDQAFLESYREAPIRRATAAQRGLWLLAAEAVTARKPDAALHLFGNRFWNKALLDHMGERLVARFDPQNIHKGLHVYRFDGTPICFAEVIDDVGFYSVDGAREKARNLRAFVRASKAAAEAERKLTAAERIALTPLPEAAPTPEPPKVVRLVNGPALTMPTQEPEFEEQSEDERRHIAAIRSLRIVHSQKEYDDE